MPLLCLFNQFLVSRAEICQIFRCCFGKFKSSKRHSEINWPLDSQWLNLCILKQIHRITKCVKLHWSIKTWAIFGSTSNHFRCNRIDKKYTLLFKNKHEIDKDYIWGLNKFLFESKTWLQHPILVQKEIW